VKTYSTAATDRWKIRIGEKEFDRFKKGERFWFHEEKMKQHKITFCVRESADGGYEAYALGFSIFTQGDTIDQLKLNALDAVTCHFDSENRPEVVLFQSLM
jgi:hypothetical protein